MGKEIDFLDAIMTIKDDGEVKVIYSNGEIEYIDQYDGLDGLNFRQFFDAKFYVDYENTETVQQLYDQLNGIEKEINELDGKKLDLMSESAFIMDKITKLGGKLL